MISGGLQILKCEDLPATEPQLASALPGWLGNMIHPQPHMAPSSSAPSSSPEKHVSSFSPFQILSPCSRVTSSWQKGPEVFGFDLAQPTDIWGNMAVPIPNVLIKNPAKQPWGQAFGPMRGLPWSKAACDWSHKLAATAFTLPRSIQTSDDGRRMCSKDANCTIEKCNPKLYRNQFQMTLVSF